MLRGVRGLGGGRMRRWVQVPECLDNVWDVERNGCVGGQAHNSTLELGIVGG